MLYIPITKELVSKLCDPVTDTKSVITNLSIEELSALHLILKLPELLRTDESQKSTLIKVERYIANFLDMSKNIDLLNLQEAIAHQFNSKQLNDGNLLRAEVPIFLLSIEKIQEKGYLKKDGSWNWSFKDQETSDFLPSRSLSRYSKTSTRTSQEEERIINTILSERDESITVQGYAGTGKTWIISQLSEALNKETTLFLAENSVQTQAIVSRAPESTALTFAHISGITLSANLVGPMRHIQRRYGRKKTLTYRKLAEYLQCHEIGNYSREMVAQKAWSAVSQYCKSDDAKITLKHTQAAFFKSTKYWHQEALLSIAESLWGLICIPREKIELPVHNYHLVKALALTGEGIPSSYLYKGVVRECTHIIVDEMHNLPPSVHQILHQSSQPVFRFGDYYQALEGLSVPIGLSPTLRKKTLSHSVRAGANTEKLYNNILEKHPIKPEVDFSGNRAKSTQVIHCKKHKIPDDYCTILTKDIWPILLIIRTLHSKNSKYHIMSSAKSELKWLINDAISFYKTGQSPRHYALRNHASWNDFIAKNTNKIPSLLEIDHLIRSGFGFSELDGLLNDVPETTLNSYVVGRVWDSRNSEYEKIRIWDDLSENPRFTNENPAKTVSHVYTGISRAKHKLYIPEKMLERFEDF